jgi:hypothetical protein
MLTGPRQRFNRARRAIAALRRAIRASQRRRRLTPAQNERFDDAVQAATKGRNDERHWQQVYDQRLNETPRNPRKLMEAASNEANAKKAAEDAEATIIELGGDPKLDVPEPDLPEITTPPAGPATTPPASRAPTAPTVDTPAPSAATPASGRPSLPPSSDSARASYA